MKNLSGSFAAALRKAEMVLKPSPVYAHCDIPCGIYETSSTTTAADTVAIEKILEIKPDTDPQKDKENRNSLVRMVHVKEEHAQCGRQQNSAPRPKFPLSIHFVKGHSMQPVLNEGDRAVVFRWAYIFSQPKKGDVVVLSSNDKKEYVKRIVAIKDKDKFAVAGDNRSDSKVLFSIAGSAIIGKVVAKY